MVKKILFVGMGSIGCRNLKNIKNLLPNAKVAALRVEKRDIKVDCSKLIDKEFYSIDDAKDYVPDIVFITNPTSFHVEVALEFTNKATGIFIEKPVSDNVFNVQKLIDLNENTIFHVSCPLRYHPTIKYIKNHLKDFYKIYNIKIISGSYLPSWRPEKNYKETYCATKKMGGGVSLDLIHEIDYMRWIFGNIKEGYFGSSKISELEIETEDIAYGIWKLDNDILCEIHLDYFRKVPIRCLEILTKKKVINVDLINSSININDGLSEKTINFDFHRNDMHIEEIKYFLQCVKYNKKSFNDLEFSLDTLKYALYMRNDVGFVNY